MLALPARVAKPVTCPESLMAVAMTIRAPQRAEVLHRRAVPQEGVSGHVVGRRGVARHLPRGVDGDATAKLPPSVPRSCIVVPSHRKA